MSPISTSQEVHQSSSPEIDREAIMRSTIRRLIGEKERLGIKLQLAEARASQFSQMARDAQPYIAFESKVALTVVRILPRFVAIPIRRIVALVYALRFR
jgi:hypothetical protein